MKWKEVSFNLVGSTIQRDIALDNGVSIQRNTVLSKNDIRTLMANKINKVFVSTVTLDKELLFQLESFITKGSQPLFWEEYIQTIEETKKFFTLVSAEIYENPEPILVRVHELINLLENEKEFFEFTYSIKGSEDSLYRHTVNVAIISYLLGESKIALESSVLLCQMGFLHDIGKAILNQNILNKPASLTVEEMSHVQSHTFNGVEILKRLGITRKEIVESVLLHHESRNGNGYPNKLKKDDIPFSVQVITTIDIFDTICSDRIYKNANSFFEALNKLYFEAAKGILNPIIVFPFIEKMFKMYQGEKIVLSNKLVGEIYYLNPKNIIRPIIQLENDTFLDLSQQKDVFIVNTYK